MNPIKVSKKVVEVCLYELMSRRSFGNVWDGIKDEDKDDIIATMILRVDQKLRKIMDKEAQKARSFSDPTP